jgi:hypothetical protein
MTPFAFALLAVEGWVATNLKISFPLNASSIN